MLFPSVIALALAASTRAAIFVTSPTDTISFTGGQPATIQWNDDGNAPSPSQFGLAKVSIYTGNSAQQTSLQTISPSVDVSNPLSINFTVDPSIGENGKYYFIRFESLALKDASNPAIPALAFSHIFSMDGMTGTFSADVQSQIDGQSTAPIGGVPTSASAAPSSTAASLTTSKASSTASSKPSGSASGSAKVAAATGSSAAVLSFVASSANLWLGIATGVFGAVVGVIVL